MTTMEQHLRSELDRLNAGRQTLAAELAEALTDRAAVIALVDPVLVDGSAPDDTGEPDEPGGVVEMVETLVVRYQQLQDVNRRLSREVGRLSRGEVPLPSAPELTGGAV